jgi:hypothetical protein
MLESQEAQKQRQIALAAQIENEGVEPMTGPDETLAALKTALLGRDSTLSVAQKLPSDSRSRLRHSRTRSGATVEVNSFMTHERALALRVAELETELKRKYEAAIRVAQPAGMSLQVIEQAKIASLTRHVSARKLSAVSSRGSSLNGALAKRRAASLLCKGDFWIVGYQGEESLIKHSKGLCHLGYLLRYPDREIHTLDLIAYSGAY